MNERIFEMINEYGEEDDFFGEVSDGEICQAEAALGVTFPVCYRSFVKKYGSGGIAGVDIEGVQGAFGASVVHATERWRKLGLDANMMVVEDAGEFARCMYSAEQNDTRVFSWTRGGNSLQPLYASFDEYILDLFQEGIDNL